MERARRRKDLERSRADERERQARHRAREKKVPVGRDRPMSLDRSDSEVMDMVEEIQKKLASLARHVERLSLDRSTPRTIDQAGECGGFRG